MSGSGMIRFSGSDDLLIKTGEALSEPFWFANKAGGQIKFSGVVSASIGFQMSVDKEGDYYPIMSRDDPLVVAEIITPVEDKWYPIPTELYGARSVKVWSQTAGGDVNQANDLTVTMSVAG